MSYKDKDELKRLYVDKGLDQEEIAEIYDVHQTTIGRWIRKYDIKRPLQDPELLEELYWENGLSLEQVANKINSYRGSVGKAMDRHGIQKRKPYKDRPPHFSHADKDGHEVWRHSINGTIHTVFVHRLLSVAEYGIESVKGMDVHHTNGIPWDNRADNLRLVTREEHNKIHNNERDKKGRFKPR